MSGRAVSGTRPAPRPGRRRHRDDTGRGTLGPVSEPGSGILSRPYLAASIAIYTMVALSAFEGLAVAAALPQVAADLGGIGLLPWVVSGFFFSSGVATIIAGPLVDTVGSRTLFRWAVGIFVAASVGAAFVPTMGLMVVARLAQGAGAGLLMSVTLAAVGLVYPARLVSRAFAANATVWGVMGVAAPGIAALMLTVLDWRWIFLVNLPLGIVALAAGWRALPGPAGSRPGRVDLPGILLVSGFTLASVVAATELRLASVAWLAAAAALAALYARHARSTADPVLRLEHLVHEPYSGIGLSMALLLVGAVGSHAYLTLYVGGGRGVGPGLTAWSVLFFTVGWTVGANIFGRALDRVAESSAILVGIAIAVPALGTVAAAGYLDAPLGVILAAFLVVGIGVGGAANATLTLLQTLSPADELGRATSAHQFLRNQGFTLGSALGGAVLLGVVGAVVGDVEAVQRLFAGETGGVSAEAAAGIRSGFATMATVGTILAAAALLPAAALRRYLGDRRLAKRGGGRDAPIIPG